MYFVNGLMALSDRLGILPDTVFIISVFCMITWWEFVGFLFTLLIKLIGSCTHFLSVYFQNQKKDR